MLFWMVVAVACLLAVGSYRQRGWFYRLTEKLADRLNTVSVGKAVFYALLLMAGLIMFALFEAEGLWVFGAFASETMMWFAIFDLALFADVMVMTVVLATSVRVKRVGGMARNLAARLMMFAVGLRAGRSQRRPRRKAGVKRPSKPSEPEPWAAVLVAC